MAKEKKPQAQPLTATDRGYATTAEAAAREYAEGQQAAEARGGEQATAIAQTQQLMEAAQAGTASEQEREAARQQQAALASQLATGQVAGSTAGRPDIESQKAQQAQLDYLRSLQTSGGAQALTATQQGQLAAALAAQASGQAPGAGQLQLRRALEATQAATAAQLGSLRGMGQTAAQRLLAQEQAAQAQKAAGQSSAVALEEQAAARQQLAGLLGTMRGQDITAQQQMADQMATALTATRQQDIAAGQLGVQQEQLGVQREQIETQRRQIAAQIFEAMRSGDTAALQTAIAAAQASGAAATAARQQDIEQTKIAQARELGYLNEQGRVDVANLQAAVQQSLQATQTSGQLDVARMSQRTQLEIAKMQTEMQVQLAEVDRKLKAGQLDDIQAEADRTYWRDLYVRMMLGAAAAQGTATMQASMGAAKGGRVRGRSAPVPGDHPANDTVPALLSPGEIVIPRSIAEAEDAPDKAAAFVRALQQSEEKPLSRRAAAKRIADLEAELAALRAMKAQKEAR